MLEKHREFILLETLKHVFMKTNKKAILGMLVAMVMSLGVMNGITNEYSQNDFNVQQAGVVFTYSSASGELGNDSLSDHERGVSAVLAVGSFAAAEALGGCAVGLCWNPAGWICGIGAGVMAL